MKLAHLLLGLVALVSVRTFAQPDDVADMEMNDFVAMLNGANEVPPLTDMQTNNAQSRLELKGNDTGYAWKLEITGVMEMTMAHIHMGDNMTNGPVIVGLLPLDAPTSAFAGGNLPMISPPVSGDFVYEGFFSEDDFVGPYAGRSLDDLMNLFMSQQAYANIHSVAFPAGVIRGQVMPEEY